MATTLKQTERNIEGSFKGKANAIVLASDNLSKNISSIVKNSSSVVSKTADTITETMRLGNNVASIFTDTQQYEDFANVAASAATSYLTGKVDRIRDLWNTKVDVTVQSLIGEVAPYALKLEKIGPNLEKKISRVMGYLLGTGTGDGTYKGILKSLGNDALDALQSNPGLNASLSNLSAIQAYANTFNVISNVIDIVKKIKTIYETIQPSVSIASNLALVFWSGGTTAVEASNTMVEEVEKEVSAIQILILYAIKKLVFPLKIKLPALLVGAVDSISVRSAMLGLEGTDYAWLGTMFDDDFFNDLEYTLTMSDAISEALSAVRSAQNSLESNLAIWRDLGGNFGKDSNGNSLERGDMLKSFFMDNVTKNYMKNISALARKTAYIPDYSNVSYFKRSSSSQMSKQNTSANTPNSKTILEYQLSNDSDENPVRNVESLRKISKTLYDNI